MGSQLLEAPVAVVRLLVRYRAILAAITRVELEKRYSGSVLGKVWILLYPALLLSVYLFVYLVVFKMRFPGYSEMDYVLYVFSGLVPYLGLMEALNASSQSIRQNMHLVRNVMLPIELVPVRAVAASLASELVSLAVVVALLAANGSLSWKVVALPLVLALQVLFLIGIAYMLAALAVALQDVAWFISLALLLLIFISPIGFKPEMVPAGFSLLVTANPIHYMAEAFRTVLIADHAADPRALAVFCVLSIVTFALGSAFFRKFKSILVDHE